MNLRRLLIVGGVTLLLGGVGFWAIYRHEVDNAQVELPPVDAKAHPPKPTQPEVPLDKPPDLSKCKALFFEVADPDLVGVRQ